MEEMKELRGRLKSQTEIENGKGSETEKERENETERGMTGGRETGESRGEKTWHHMARAKEVMF